MSPLRSRWRLLAPLLALVSVLAAGLLSAPPASAAVVAPARSPAATCSSSIAAVVVASIGLPGYGWYYGYGFLLP